MKYMNKGEKAVLIGGIILLLLLSMFLDYRDSGLARSGSYPKQGPPANGPVGILPMTPTRTCV